MYKVHIKNMKIYLLLKKYYMNDKSPCIKYGRDSFTKSQKKSKLYIFFSSKTIFH